VFPEFSVLNKYFYHSGFLSNLRLPWKTELPWRFSRQGVGRPADPFYAYARTNNYHGFFKLVETLLKIHSCFSHSI